MHGGPAAGVEERYQAHLLDIVDDGVVGTDADFCITHWNVGAERLYGYVAAEVLGLPARDVATFAGDDSRARLERDLLEHGRSRLDLTAVRRDGTPVEVEVVMTAVRDEAGAVQGYLGIHRDVTERRAAGRLEVLSAVVANSRDFIGSTDAEGQAAERDSARRAEQRAVVARLGARSAQADDLSAFLDDAVRRIGRAVGATFALMAELTAAGDRLIVRAGTGFERGDELVVGTRDADDLFGRALADRAAVVIDDVLTGELDVAPALRAQRPVAAAVVPVAGRDEVYGALAVFSDAARRFAPPDVDFLAAAAHVLSAAIERSRTALRLEQARDAERRRIARALHDEALQDTRFALARAEAPPDGSKPDELLVGALTRIGRELRSAVYDLRPTDDERTLDDRLREVVDRHRRMAPELQVDLYLADLSERRPQRTSAELVRILDEALTNVRRHAGAERVTVRAWTSVGQLWGEVTDDGRGASVGAMPGQGIAGMRERAARLGGEVDFRTPEGGGTAVRVRLPVSPSREAGQPIRVLLVEDHAAVREAIAGAFRRERDFEVVGEAASLAEARGMLEDVDVALVDLALPDGDGGDLIAALREAVPDAHAIVLSAGLDRSAVARAVERGAAGAFPKSDPLPDVIDAVRRVRAGETLLPLEEVVELLRFASRERERELLDRRAIESLTTRELEVLQLVADGCDSREAASRLHISVRTQRNHVASILGKLGVHSQLQALIFALRYQLVELRSAEC
jgi:PAS domain S-box-containing protein